MPNWIVLYTSSIRGDKVPDGRARNRIMHMMWCSSNSQQLVCVVCDATSNCWPGQKRAAATATCCAPAPTRYNSKSVLPSEWVYSISIYLPDKLVVLPSVGTLYSVLMAIYAGRQTDRPVIYGQDTYNKPELQRGLLLLGWVAKKWEGMGVALGEKFTIRIHFYCRHALSSFLSLGHSILLPLFVGHFHMQVTFLFFLPACLPVFLNFSYIFFCRWQLQLFDAWFVERLFAFRFFPA